MRRITTLIGAGLVAAATASLIAVGVGGGAEPAPVAHTLTFVERTVPGADVVADVPPVGGPTSKGDSLMFRNEVLTHTGDKVGIHEGRCTYLAVTTEVVGSRLICDGIYTLAEGTLSSQTAFTFTENPRISFTVDGGTGAYEGARGSGTLTYRSPHDPHSDTVIRLLP
jgi:hypothetical protein